MERQKSPKVFKKQPILCPWISSQPYHSSLWNKNKPAVTNSTDPSITNRLLSSPWNINRQMPLGLSRIHDKSLPSIQQSSSQFFYFLRLMQLFPDTHPATLHTVLALCKNDFFCAVDKLLYAKRCKLLCYKKNIVKKNNAHQTRKCICNNHGSSTNERAGGAIVKNEQGKQSGGGGSSSLTLNLTVNNNNGQIKRVFTDDAGTPPTSVLQQDLSEQVVNFDENVEDLSPPIKNILIATETVLPST